MGWAQQISQGRRRLHRMALAIGGTCVVFLSASCAEDIKKSPPLTATTAPLFELTLPSPVIPLPNDAAKHPETGLLAVPVADETVNPAQAEFDRFLNTLDGFPTSSGASLCFNGALDATTITANIAVFGVDASGTPAPVTDLTIGSPIQTLACPVLTATHCDPTAATSTCDATQRCVATNSRLPTAGSCANPGWAVSISRNSPWDRGTLYAFYVLNGLRDAAGNALIRPSLFEITAQANPLCDFDTTAGACVFNYSSLLQTAVAEAVREANHESPTPLDEEALRAEISKAVLASATSFERLRQATGQLLDLADAATLGRDNVLMAWAFTTVSQVEATFDPTGGVLPGPGNDLIFRRICETDADCTGGGTCDTGTGACSTSIKAEVVNGRVNIPPSPACTADTDCAAGGTCDTTTGECSTFHNTEGQSATALRRGLNTLDGFSTTASYYTGFTGDLDPTSVDASANFLILDTTDPLANPPVTATFKWEPTAGIVTMTPDRPLEENHRYAVVMLSKVATTTDAAGNTVATAASGGGLADTTGRRVVPSPTFALARMANALVDESGKSRISVLDDASANALEALRSSYNGLLTSLEANPALQVNRNDVAILWTFTTQSFSSDAQTFRALPYQAFAAPSPLDDNNMPMFTGTVAPAATMPAGVPNSAIASWVPDGTFNTVILLDPTTGAFNPSGTVAPATVNFFMTIPMGTEPAAGWPVVIFQHGITRAKSDFFAVANTLASAGFATIATDIIFHGDRTRCTEDTDCTSPGTCQADGTCTTSFLDADADGVPDASGGGAFLNVANPFAIRDNIRQHFIDASSLVRAIVLGAGQGLSTPTGLNGGNISWVGHSLGAIIGTGFVGLESNVKRAVLNVPGAPIVRIFQDTNNPNFQALIAGILQANGITAGTVEEFQLFHTFQWILDPADGGNYARFVKDVALTDLITQAPVPATPTLVQIAGMDNVIPTERQEAIASWMGIDVTNSTYPNADHGLLLDPSSSDGPTLQAAQTQMVTFLATETVCTPNTTNGTCN